jgi:hypothetical protein
MPPKMTCGDKICDYDPYDGMWVCKNAAGTGVAYNLDANINCDVIVPNLVYSPKRRRY